MAPTHLTTIVHLTDLHLCLTPEGDSLGAEDRSALAWALKKARVGYKLIAGHEADAWDSLKTSLETVIRRELDEGGGAPVIVAQTGDVEALGGLGDPNHADPYEQFTGFKAVHRLRDEIKRDLEGAGECEWIDIYGNHDAWGDMSAVPRPRVVNELALIPGMEGTWPDHCHSTTGRVPVHVFRVNSVVPNAIGALAFGRVGSHLPGMTVDQALHLLDKSVAQAGSEAAVRVAVMHHPPHDFDAGFMHRRFARLSSLGKASLHGAAELAATAEKSEIQLVIAGHRHRYDPGAEEGSRGLGRQPPLGSRTAQLVAGSPTKWQSGLSFPTYRLLYEDDGTLTVQRRIWYYLKGQGELGPGGRFALRRGSREWTTLFSGLPIS